MFHVKSQGDAFLQMPDTLLIYHHRWDSPLSYDTDMHLVSLWFLTHHSSVFPAFIPWVTTKNNRIKMKTLCSIACLHQYPMQCVPLMWSISVSYEMAIYAAGAADMKVGSICVTQPLWWLTKQLCNPYSTVCYHGCIHPVNAGFFPLLCFTACQSIHSTASS